MFSCCSIHISRPLFPSNISDYIVSRYNCTVVTEKLDSCVPNRHSDNYLITFTLSAAPTGPPQNIIALVVEATSLTLSWEPPVASEQNGIITSYDIEMTTETGEIFDFSTSSTTYTISNLEPYKIYQFVIAALTMSGQGPFSSDIAIRTGEAGKYKCRASCYVI